MSTSHPSEVETRSAFDPQRQRRSRLMLLGLFAVFGVPLLLATLWLHWVRTGGTDIASTSHGELISPAVPIASFELAELAPPGNEQPGLAQMTEHAARFDEADFRGIWTLLYLPVGECADRCQQNLYHMRQVRLALNHRMNRVQRVVVLEHRDQLPVAVLDAHPGLRALYGPRQDRAVLSTQIEAAEAALPARENPLYLIDPFGNLMLRFPSDLSPKSMLEDIKHLLKISRIG